MTKIDLSQFKPIPGFDSLKWKQEVQAKIHEETKHMTPEQRRERERQASERMCKEREQYQAEQAAGDPTVPVFTMQ
jgi:hypothetical protein